jgi:hypothetical protein
MKPHDAQINAEIFPEGAPIRCRYMRVKGVPAGYPLRVTTLLRLIKERKIKSLVLKDHGAIRGMRLIDRDSLNLFFEMEAVKAEAAEKNRAQDNDGPGRLHLTDLHGRKWTVIGRKMYIWFTLPLYIWLTLT